MPTTRQGGLSSSRRRAPPRTALRNSPWQIMTPILSMEIVGFDGGWLRTASPTSSRHAHAHREAGRLVLKPPSRVATHGIAEICFGKRRVIAGTGEWKGSSAAAAGTRSAGWDSVSRNSFPKGAWEDHSPPCRLKIRGTFDSAAEERRGRGSREQVQSLPPLSLCPSAANRTSSGATCRK